jgi:hypothetical protein
VRELIVQPGTGDSDAVQPAGTAIVYEEAVIAVVRVEPPTPSTSVSLVDKLTK